jgi:hypothetical protein
MKSNYSVIKKGIRVFEYTIGGLFLALYLFGVFIYTTVMLQGFGILYSVQVGLTKSFYGMTQFKSYLIIYIILVIIFELFFYVRAKNK